MRPRFVRTGLTILVLIAVMGTAGYVGWKYTLAPLPGLGVISNCTTQTVQENLRTSQVQVSVYNDGTRAGLASKVAKALVRRGFIGGDVANTPTKEHVKTVLVRTTTADSTAAKLVARQFAKSLDKIKIVVSTSVDLGPGIDVVVGNKFQGLVKKAPKSLPYTTTQQVCSGP